MSSFGGSVKLTGESEYRKALKEITSNLKVLNSEMKVVTSQYDKNDTSVDNLSAQHEILNKKIVEQRNAVDILADALEKSKAETGENSKETKDWQIKLNNAQAELNKLNRELYANADSLAEARTNEEKLNNTKKTTINSFRDFSAELIKSVAGASNLGQTIKNDLNVRVDEMADKVIDGVDKIKAFGDAVVHPKKLGDAIKEKLVDIADKVKSSTNEQADSVEDFGKEAEKSGEKTLKLGDIIKANLISEAIKGGLKALADGMKKVGGAMLDLGKEAVNAFGELEQNLGGSEAVFGKYAESVQKLGEDAYKNLGITQSQYLATANKMGSLFQGSGIEQQRAVELTTQAMQRATDVASIMGIDMESALEAVTGAAKGNFTMMDNLGVAMNATNLEAYALEKGLNFCWKEATQAEKAELAMQMFFDKTSQYAGNFEKESTQTISGSIGLLTASVNTLKAGLGNANADMVNLSQNVIDAFMSTIDNVAPIIDNIIQSMPVVIETLSNAISEKLPMLLEMGISLLSSLLDGISSSLDKLFPVVMSVVRTLVGAFVSNLPMIIEMGIQMIVSLINGIAEMLPELIPMAIDCIITIVDALIDNLDLIIDAAINIIMALADGLIEALPDLVDKIPVIIDKLIMAITDNLPKIIVMGCDILLKLGDGLVKAVPQLLAKVPMIIASILNAFGQILGLGKIGDIGRDLIQGLWNGIVSVTDWILNKIKGFGDTILNGIKSFFGIHSPSKVFKDEIGANLALGVGEGFADTMKDVSDEMNEAIPTEFDADISTNINGLTASPMTQFDMMVSAFKKALTEVNVVMDDREMGRFVTNTIERVVYA